MTPHIVTSYDDDLKVLDRLIVDMGHSVLKLHFDGLKLLQSIPDIELAQSIIAADQAIEEMQSVIEEKSILTIARRQPVAIDLRTIIASLRIATDLERIGDLAKNNAKRILASSGRPQLTEISGNLKSLAERVGGQIGDALEAFERRDEGLAQKVWKLDAEIDTMQTSMAGALTERSTSRTASTVRPSLMAASYMGMSELWSAEKYCYSRDSRSQMPVRPSASKARAPCSPRRTWMSGSGMPRPASSRATTSAADASSITATRWFPRSSAVPGMYRG